LDGGEDFVHVSPKSGQFGDEEDVGSVVETKGEAFVEDCSLVVPTYSRDVLFESL